MTHDMFEYKYKEQVQRFDQQIMEDRKEETDLTSESREIKYPLILMGGARCQTFNKTLQ